MPDDLAGLHEAGKAPLGADGGGGASEGGGGGDADSLRVVLIDGDASHVATVYDALPDASGGRLTVAGTATKVDDGLKVVATEKPSVVVLGLNLAGGSLDLLSKLLADQSFTGKVVVVAAEDAADAAEAAALGAHAVVNRGGSAQHLLAPILGVVQGWRVFAEPVVRELVIGARRPGAELLGDLDDEAVQLWMLVAEGLDLPTIATRLEVDEHTVKQRVSDLRVKVGAANRTQLAALAGRAGLIDDGWLDGTVPGA